MENTNLLNNKHIASFGKEEELVLGLENNKPMVIDLFAGCGGLSLGLYQAGWEGLFAIEKNAFAFETLKYNLIDNKKHFQWPEWLPQTEHDIKIKKKYTISGKMHKLEVSRYTQIGNSIPTLFAEQAGRVAMEMLGD